jgi:hypothetical protein
MNLLFPSGGIQPRISGLVNKASNCFPLLDKQPSCNEKIVSDSIRHTSSTTKDENYTLVDLAPEGILVEFSEDSSADPTNWTLVS